MLCFGVVCLAFDVDDDPEHESCGSGGTVHMLEPRPSVFVCTVKASRQMVQGGGITMIVMSSFLIGYLMVSTLQGLRILTLTMVRCSGAAHGPVQAGRNIAAFRLNFYALRFDSSRLAAWCHYAFHHSRK